MIELDDVSVRLGERLALDRVTATIETGELVAVLGPNGAGKSTLLKAIAGLVVARGRIALDGREIAAMRSTQRARAIAYLPQGHIAHWPITVRDTVTIGRMPHGALPGRTSAADDAAIERALTACDAVQFAERPVTALSGGERARVMLARALAVEAPVLLVDEPIAALDPAHQLAVMGLIARAAAAGTTVLAALHDLTLAARFATRAIVLDQARLVADGPPRQILTPELLARTFNISALHLAHAGTPVLVPWLPQADLRT